jgi:hypothetical protein
MPHARVAAKRWHSAETGGRYAQNSVSFALKPKSVREMITFDRHSACCWPTRRVASVRPAERHTAIHIIWSRFVKELCRSMPPDSKKRKVATTEDTSAVGIGIRG